MVNPMQELLGPAVLKTFLDDYWPFKPAYLPVSVERIASMFPTLSRIPLRQLIGNYSAPIYAVFSGDTTGYQQRLTDGAQALAAFDAGVSLCLSALHTLSAETSRMLGSIAEVLALSQSATQCNCYVSAAGEGVPWHFDDREVIVVQLQGRKQWTIALNSEVAFPTMNFVLATGGPSDEDEMSRYASRTIAGPQPEDERHLLLEPGSMLFMPRGTWHRTTAHEPSLSLTCGLFATTGLSVLLAAVRAQGVADAELRAPIPVATPDQRERSRVRLLELLAVWQKNVASRTPEELLNLVAAAPSQ